MERLGAGAHDAADATQHPGYVHIPDTGTEGVRSYREPADPHPLQLTFLTAEGEREWIETTRSLLVEGRFDAAAARIEGALAPFDGRIARLAKSLRVEDIVIDGWEDLDEIIAEFQGPPITAITAGLGNESDLVFDAGAQHEPTLMFNLFSDDVYDFTSKSRAELLAECAADCPGWAGEEEDVEFYVSIEGFAPLNSALIQCKHIHFLRDGRDGVEGRAPGGYCEFVLGAWLRTARFLQAIRRAVETHGMPPGVGLITGTFGMHADLATIIDPQSEATDSPSESVAPVATLTMKKWQPKHDPLADMETGTSLRQRVAAGDVVAPEAEQPPVVEAPAPVVAPLAPVHEEPVVVEEMPVAQEPLEDSVEDDVGERWWTRLWRRLVG